MVSKSLLLIIMMGIVITMLIAVNPVFAQSSSSSSSSSSSNPFNSTNPYSQAIITVEYNVQIEPPPASGEAYINTWFNLMVTPVNSSAFNVTMIVNTNTNNNVTFDLMIGNYSDGTAYIYEDLGSYTLSGTTTETITVDEVGNAQYVLWYVDIQTPSGQVYIYPPTNNNGEQTVFASQITLVQYSYSWIASLIPYLLFAVALKFIGRSSLREMGLGMILFSIIVGSLLTVIGVFTPIALLMTSIFVIIGGLLIFFSRNVER
jgi:hypothetical protein